ncbi:uncharacterized protein LOC131019683 [Salvia miltiorrhiza]|uniref:uncharacterized protein LOC131019683 n=1 Tax=Salvia miltiorrhiza TaxID=226208 RepID=UPI0025AD39FB|nr:uncharacterized protein LOC131019683 [Salvia miltiorrhiza]
MIKMEATNRRFDRRPPNDGRPSISLQKKLAETRHATNQMPDITDLMNDMFFGTTNDGDGKKGYNLTEGGGRAVRDRRDDDFDSSTRSVSSRQTQEWLEEAKKMVASSPSRGGDSPSRLVSSPRFASSQGRLSTSSIDKRDPFSRSARRHRAVQGISGEILSRTAANHTRNRSESNLDPPQSDSEPSSPASEIQKWISNNLKIPNNNPDPIISPEPTPPSPTSNLGAPPLPPRQSFHRRTRFQTDPRSPLSHPITTPTNPPANSIPKRTFKSTPPNTNTIPDNQQLLSPPRNLVDSAHRRSLSSSTCSVPDAGLLSPPRNLVESAHRRSVSSSTCRNDKIFQKDNSDDGQIHKGVSKDQEPDGFSKDQDFNSFLKEQRLKIEMLMNGEIKGKAKIVLSGPSNSTSSMVAATCYAWLLENKNRASKKEGARNGNVVEFVVPVMNIRRGKMWKQRQAAWLFHHAGLDASSLLFSNEVDLETLMMEMQLSMLVVGEDILKTNGEVGSGCTVLTDNYCEDAYDLLQTPILKKLLMAGILLDTQNLSPSPKLSMTRDAEAVQLLSVASAPNYRNTLFDQLMQDHKEADFYKVLCKTYGKPPSEIDWENEAPTERRTTSEKISPNKVNDDKKRDVTNETRMKKVSPVSGKPTPSPVNEAGKANEANRGKNRNFFAKLFGFGSK